HGRELRARRVILREPILQLVDVVLVVVEERRDVGLTVRPAQLGVLLTAVEAAFELVAVLLDLFDERLDVLVRKARRGILRREKNGREQEPAREYERQRSAKWLTTRRDVRHGTLRGSLQVGAEEL